MERLGAGVTRELGRFGAGAELSEIARAWTAVAGRDVARNAFPARVSRDGVLHVATSSSLWAFELTQLADTLLARLRDELGNTAPRRVRFAVGAIPEPATDPGDGGGRVQPRQEDDALAATLVAQIDDDELRLLIRRAAALSLARDASGRRF